MKLKYREKDFRSYDRISALAATFLLLLAATSAMGQTAFEGALKKISISDTAGTNSPPIANFTYSQQDNVITFDASQSTDPDGKIIKYGWDFGDGRKAEGQTSTFALTDESKFNVTLTVLDDKNGVALTNEEVSIGSKTIFDDFSFNTVAKYTLLSGDITISDGVIHGKSYTNTKIIHTTDLQNVDHWVQADIYYGGKSDSGGLISRFSPLTKSMYSTYFAAGRIYVSGSNNWTALYSGGYQEGFYTVRIEHVGSAIKVYVNNNLVISKIDNAAINGQFAGIILSRSNINTDVTADNFSAGSQ